MTHTKVIAEGSYLPEKILMNSELVEAIDSYEEWIVERTGILSRRIAGPGEYTSDLGAKALQDALMHYNIPPSSIDGIIVATTTADQVFPSTASIIQNKVGIQNAALCFDVGVACAGFVYALSIADSLIKSGAASRIAVIGAETMSRIVDWTDRGTSILFGDGAGAFIIEATEEPDKGILGYNLFNDAKSYEILQVEGGVSRGNMEYSKILMNGREVFKKAVEKMTESSLVLLEKLGMSVEEIDWLLPHQANQRILVALADKLGLEPNKLISTVALHANTSAASIPLAYSHVLREGRIKSGDLIMMSAVGAGLSWGSLLMRV